MSATINVPKIRVGSSIPMAVTLTDNGVAVDWSSVEEIVVMLYFEGKKLFGGKCTHVVSGTTLNVMYSADKPQFLGIADVVVNCKYLGMEKTFDRPVVEFVATTSEATGQSQIARDPLAVDIDVEDVDTSLLDAAIHAAVAAAEAANEAASHGPMIGEDGYWYVWDAAQGEYVNTGVYAEGSGGGSDTSNCVKVIEQSFSMEQKAQARANIGAGTYSKPAGGIPAADLASGVVPDVSGKADKVSGATADNFAGLDANGNLKDSGKKASDFATAAQGAKADTAYQKPVSGIPSTDIAAGVIPDVSGFYTKPAGGIPSTDLASGVQTSLGKADTAIQPSQTAGLLKNDGTVDTTAYGTYSKPSGGIPSSDMASAVQTSLGKADTAYQKPVSGIPASDLASGVIPDAVEANPTVPSGTTPTDLEHLKVGNSYFGIPSGGISDAPSDGVPYLRKNGAWASLISEAGETVNIILATSDSSGAEEGATVTVTYEGQAHTYTYVAGGISVSVPAGVSYTVDVSPIADYITPPSQAYTSLFANSRNVTLTYQAFAYGVYILDAEDEIHAVSGWDSADNAHAVGVLINGPVTLVLYKDQNTTGLTWQTGADTLFPGVETGETASDFFNTYTGRANTEAILTAVQSLGVTAPAAAWAASVNFINGKTGYLPSLGELKLITDNLSAVNAALLAIGGASINPDWYTYTSTQVSDASAWVYISGIYMGRSKGDNYHTIAIAVYNFNE